MPRRYVGKPRISFGLHSRYHSIIDKQKKERTTSKLAQRGIDIPRKNTKIYAQLTTTTLKTHSGDIAPPAARSGFFSDLRRSQRGCRSIAMWLSPDRPRNAMVLAVNAAKPSERLEKVANLFGLPNASVSEPRFAVVCKVGCPLLNGAFV